MKSICLLLLVSFLATLSLCAQRKSQRQDSLRINARRAMRHSDILRHRMDSVMDMRSKKANVDTNYIIKPGNKWTLKTRVNFSGTDVKARTNFQGEKLEADIQSELKLTLSVAAAYRGISLAVALNPAHLAGKNNDYEFNLNAYGNRFGGDVIYHSAKRFRGTITKGGENYKVSGKLIQQKIWNLDTYYAFNYRRFSYPAAFSQSYIQRRSAGSWLLGMSFLGGSFLMGADEEMNTPTVKIRMEHIGIGGGYGYNLVTRHHWLFHLSSIPSLVVYSGFRTFVDGEKVRLSYHFPEMIFVGRLAIIHEMSRFFGGVTAVFNTSVIGDDNLMEILNNKWRCRLVFGIRL